jgi:hypothetical protein
MGIEAGASGGGDPAGEGGGSGGEAGAPPAGGAGGSTPTGGTGGSVGPAGTGGGASTGTAGMGGGATFDAGTDPERNAVTAGMICERLATIQCAGEAYCCESPGRDFAACKQKQMSDCDTMAMVDDIASDASTMFDAAQARVVFTELERLASTCDPGISPFGESFGGLRSMFGGTVGEGGDCAPQNPLNKAMAGAALASCTGHETQACLPSLSDWVCTPHAAAGGKCFSDVNCNLGLYCPNASFSLRGSTCTARKADGAECELPNECTSLYCKGGMCVPASAQAAYCLATP